MKRRQEPEIQMIRGEEMKTGGRYVGTTRGGIKWVSYGDNEDFKGMCENFDKNYK